MKRLGTIILLLAIAGSAVGQTQFSSKVRISKWRNVKRIDTLKEPKVRNIGDKVTTEFTYTDAVGDVHSVERVTTIAKIDTVLVDKTKKVDMKGLRGFASISPDKDKADQLKVSYWLNPRHKVDSGTIVCDSLFIWASETSVTMIPDTSTHPANDTLKHDTCYSLWKLTPSEYDSLRKTENWVKHTPRKVTVYKNNKVAYYLIDKYVSTAEYFIPVKNREYLRFNASNWDLGAITVPFKIRSAYHHTRTDGTKVKVPVDIGSDFNVGLFGGWSYGTERYRYEGGEMKRLSNLKFTVGGFISLGKQDLDSLNTTASDKPFIGDDKRSMMITSLGAGVMASFFDIKLALFVGTDLGAGEYSGRWNHHAKPWFGIGFGYNLAGLLPKKE